MTDKKYPYAISYSHAIKIVQQYAANKRLKTHTVKLEQAVNCYLAAHVTSPVNVPGNDCSRMDGFAVCYDTYRNHQDGCFKLTEPHYAGDGNTTKNIASEDLIAVPVMTGALLPKGTDTVVMKEHVTIDGGQIRLNQPVQKNQHLRKTGSDIKQGQTLLKHSHKISAADLGLLAAVGVHEVMVYNKPQVALIMTGNELVSPGAVAPDQLQAGQVYDSISLMLAELIQQMGCDVTILPVLHDNEREVMKRLEAISQQDYDLVVTVGGVSMGDRDLLPKMVANHGEVYFHKCLIKPGFPVLFGQLGEALYFGLPGNPVSAYVTCFEIVYPALLEILKSGHQSLVSWRAEILQDYNKTHMKREFLRGQYNVNVNGTIEVMVCGDQQSSRVKSLSEANCFIVMNESQLELRRGQTVVIHPFNQLY